MSSTLLRRSAILLTILLQTPSSSADEIKVTYHGDVNFESTDYLEPLGPGNAFLETIRGHFDGGVRYQDFRLKVNPLFQLDPLNHTPNERYWIDLPQGYVQYQKSEFTFQLGFNTYNWGVTDGFNPLDVVNARRLQDPVNADKMGAFSANVKADLGWGVLEALYIPFQRKSILPGENSNWLPREVFTTTSIGNGSQAATLNLPANLDYTINRSGIERNDALSNNFGLRAQFNSVFPGLDLSLEGFNGAADTPAIDVIASGTVTQFSPAIVVQADPGVTLIPVYYRQWVYGGSFVYTNFGMIFKGEMAVTRVMTRSPDVYGDAEEYVVGVERPFPVFGQDLNVIVQGTHARHTEAINNSTISLSRIFDRAGILGLRYAFSEKLNVLATGLYDFESHGNLVHVEFNYAATDTVKLSLAGDSLDGDANTPIGTFRKNDRIMGGAKLAF